VTVRWIAPAIHAPDRARGLVRIVDVAFLLSFASPLPAAA
jgi:hypothetical protein